ncbi:hypothetical protein V6N11_008775 [Hibiscus sabdariffa]|uniref:Uncharacterized protein n=1 Tax=Hibiscus sabdariffa TaxID=183260 RepID=A0ABR2NR77_9ROSI
MNGRLFGIRMCRNGSMFSFGLREANDSSLIGNGFDNILRAPLDVSYAIRVMMSPSFMPLEIVLLLLVCGTWWFGQIRSFLSRVYPLKTDSCLIYGFKDILWMTRTIAKLLKHGYLLGHEGLVRKWLSSYRG